MSYLKRHKDKNHAEVVAAFRAAGCTVEVHEPSTAGAPDLIVGCFGVNLLVEVKPLNAPKAQRELRESQVEWHARWRGRKPVVVRSVDDALALVSEVRGRLFSSEVTR